jgi:GNAT superfamily N-acetyltransferase
MSLELVQVPTHMGVPLFDHERRGYRFNWLRPVRDPGRCAYYQGLRGGVEVARLETDEVVYLDYYAGVPPLRNIALEIEVLDVHEDFRRRGIGRAAVERLARMHPDRCLVALSQDDESDRFWGEGMGWSRYEHKDNDGRRPGSRPAYVQPETEPWAGVR